MFMRKKVLLLVAAGFLLLNISNGTAENPVPNGDFMRVKEDGTPADWDIIESQAEKGTYEITVSKEELHENKYCLIMRLKGTDSYFENRKGSIGVRSKRFAVASGEKYVFSYKIKTDGLQEAGKRDAKGIMPGSKYASVIVYFFDAQGKYLTTRTNYYFSDVAEFKAEKLEIAIPEGAHQSLLQPMLSNLSREDTATVWLNDFRVERILPEMKDAKYPSPTKKIYAEKIQTINQHREEKYLENYALVSRGASAWTNSVLNEGTKNAYEANYAIDGIAETSPAAGSSIVSQWVGKPGAQQEGPYLLKIALPEKKTVCSTFWMRWTAEGVHQNRSPNKYRIKVSEDDKNWKIVADVSKYQYNSRYDNFEPVQAQYVLLEIDEIQLGSTHGPAIIDFKVLGLKKGVKEDYTGWWDKNWHYRMQFGTREKTGTVEIPVNFTQTAGIIGERFLEESLRIIASGKKNVSCLFVRDADYDGEKNASGTLMFVAEKGTEYYCYFDIDTNGRKDTPDFSIDGMTFTPYFGRDGWGCKIGLQPEKITEAAVFDNRDNPVKKIDTSGKKEQFTTTVDLNFTSRYYARVRTKEGIFHHVWLAEPSSENFESQIQLPRKVFARNENISIKTILVNKGSGTLDGTLSIGIRDKGGAEWYRKKETFQVPVSKINEIDTDFDRVNLKENNYTVSVLIRDKDGTFLVSPRETEMKIVENKEIKFIYGSFGTEYTRGQAGYDKTLRVIKEAGMNAVAGNDTATLNDYLEYGLKALGKIAWPFIGGKEYAAMNYKGEPVYPLFIKDVGSVWYPNYTHPQVQEYAKKSFKNYLENIIKHPAFSGYVFTNDDYQLPEKLNTHNFAGYSETDKALFKKLTGSEPPKPQDVELKTGIIPDDDLWSRFVLFRVEELYAKGNHQPLIEVKNEVAPWVKVGNVHGPMQDNFFVVSQGLYPPVQQAVMDFVGGYSYLNQWREWKRYTAYGDLCRMGKRNREKDRELILVPPLAHTCGFKHAGNGIYKRDGLMPADWQFRNVVYQLLAGGFGGFWFYGWKDGDRDVSDKPELLAEVGRIGALLENYGPFLKSLHTPDKPVGLLVSITDSAYGRECLPSAKIHNMNHTLIMLDEFLREHIPAEAFCEEEVLEGILSKYKVVVLYNLTVMKKSVAEKIQEHINRGGKVILSGKNDFIPLQNVEKVAPDKLTGRLRELVTLPADTPSREITIREFSDGSVTYIFFVDCFFDKYTFNIRGRYPEYWAQWADEDMTVKVAPKKEEITLSRNFKYAVDVFGQKELQLIPDGNGSKFTLEMEPGGGKLIAFYPDKAERMNVVIPEKITAGDKFNISLQVSGKEGREFTGNLPVRIDVYDSKGGLNRISDNYVARNGKLEVTMHTAVNDTKGKTRVVVTEMSTGASAEKDLQVQ